MTKYTRDEIAKYYEILGLNPNEEGLVIDDSLRLTSIGDLYELNEFDRKLPYTSKDLSDAYSLLINMIKDGFWYNTKKRQENAYNAAHEIIDELTCFDVRNPHDSDEKSVTLGPEITKEKETSLKTTIIRGLCEAGDLIEFRLYQKNVTATEVHDKILSIIKEEKEKETAKAKAVLEKNNKIPKRGANIIYPLKYYNKVQPDEEIEEEEDEYKTPKDLMSLYYLITYSKFDIFHDAYKMFDGSRKFWLSNLKTIVRTRIISDEQEQVLGQLGIKFKQINENDDTKPTFIVYKKKQKK